MTRITFNRSQDSCICNNFKNIFKVKKRQSSVPIHWNKETITINCKQLNINELYFVFFSRRGKDFYSTRNEMFIVEKQNEHQKEMITITNTEKKDPFLCKKKTQRERTDKSIHSIFIGYIFSRRKKKSRKENWNEPFFSNCPKSCQKSNHKLLEYRIQRQKEDKKEKTKKDNTLIFNIQRTYIIGRQKWFFFTLVEGLVSTVWN